MSGVKILKDWAKPVIPPLKSVAISNHSAPDNNYTISPLVTFKLDPASLHPYRMDLTMPENMNDYCLYNGDSLSEFAHGILQLIGEEPVTRD